MVDNQAFFEGLQRAGIGFFTGVPDSLLKSFCSYVMDHTDAGAHVLAANEGAAVALAAGHYLATGQPGLVYLQNSGLGNAVNPIVSLADPAVYGIPMMLLVGWRGEPGVKDEPQHVKQGEVTEAICRAIDMPFRHLPADTGPALESIGEMVPLARDARRPVAWIVRSGTFAPYDARPRQPVPYGLIREEAIAAIARSLPAQAVIVSTTGHISRELFEFRARAGLGHHQDFLTVGSMGHCSQIALGIALARPDRPVVCLDGDGALLMHMGAMALTGTSGARNYLHIVLNNGAHVSVGGQKTVGFDVDFVRMAEACGYRTARRIEPLDDLTDLLASLSFRDGPVFLEIRVSTKARKDLGRPTSSPQENMADFMAALNRP